MTVRAAKIFSEGQTLRLTAEDQAGDKFVLLFGKNKALILTLKADRLLYDGIGTCFACEDETLMVDTTDRTGVGIISLPANHWSEVAAKVHDFETSCLVYQLSNNRSEAEAHFASLLDFIANTPGRKVLRSVLTGISKSLSWFFWDVRKTRFK